MSFALATLKTGRTFVPAIRVGAAFWPIPATARVAKIEVVPGGVFDYLQNWRKAFAQLKRLAAAIERGVVPGRYAVGTARARLDTPIRYPRKVFCTGANYQDHLEEMGASSIKKVRGVPPFFFLKPGSTAVVGPGPTVHIPRGSTNFDWEVEVAVVFAKRGRDIVEKDALDYIAGYSLAIDFTARDMLFAPDTYFKFNFTLGKCQDAMTPVGPVFVPKEFADGADLPFSLSVNGVEKQNSSTKHMIYSLREQIAGASRAVTIEPGDIMLTGSPAGVGYPRGEKLAVGDSVIVDSPVTGSMQVTIQKSFK